MSAKEGEQKNKKEEVGQKEGEIGNGNEGHGMENMKWMIGAGGLFGGGGVGCEDGDGDKVDEYEAEMARRAEESWREEEERDFELVL